MVVGDEASASSWRQARGVGPQPVVPAPEASERQPMEGHSSLDLGMVLKTLCLKN